MHNALDFVPPPAPAIGHAMVRALVVHAVLLLALTWGVSWNHHTSTQQVFEAELWSSVPQRTAPAAETVPPIDSESSPPPDLHRAPVVTQPLPSSVNTPDIRLAQEQKSAAKRREKEQEREKERQEQIQKMLALAGVGASKNGGAAAQTSSATPGYADKIEGRVVPNITFPDRDTTPGNPVTKVQFKIAPDGTILSPTIRVLSSSGLPAWDKAVVNAIEKTGQIPRDADGRFPDTLFELSIRMRR